MFSFLFLLFRLESDSVKYNISDYNMNQVSVNDLSIPGFQLLKSDYWDKEILMSLDTLPHQKELFTEQQLERHNGIKPFFSIEQVDGVFALLLLCFLFLTHIYKGGFIFFRENAPLVFSMRKNVNQLSETTVSEFWYNFILVFQFILLSAIILFAFFLSKDNSYVPPNSFLTIVLFMLTISLFGGIKYMIYKIIGYIFDIQEGIKIWLRSYMIMIEIMGLAAFIPVLFLVYSNYLQLALIVFFFALFIFSRLIIIYRITLFFLQENVNFLFLIAYLCSVEIIPYILLYEELLYLFKIDIISLLWH